MKKYLECPICTHVLNEPITNTCQHTFCKTCIINLVNCPLCDQKIHKKLLKENSRIVNYNLKNIIISIFGETYYNTIYNADPNRSKKLIYYTEPDMNFRYNEIDYSLYYLIFSILSLIMVVLVLRLNKFL